MTWWGKDKRDRFMVEAFFHSIRCRALDFCALIGEEMVSNEQTNIPICYLPRDFFTAT